MENENGTDHEAEPGSSTDPRAEEKRRRLDEVITYVLKSDQPWMTAPEFHKLVHERLLARKKREEEERNKRSNNDPPGGMPPA